MRAATLLLEVLFLASVCGAQSVQTALIGNWAGYLEYRDYSEPSTSTKRVQLPTWLTVTQAANNLKLHYTYDDGPEKIVVEDEQLAFDLSRNTYTSTEPGHAPDTYNVQGFDALKNGRGTLLLTGTGTDDNRPAERRITLTIRRNLLEWLLEARPKNSTEPFAFRHLYRLTRVEPPTVVTSAPK